MKSLPRMRRAHSEGDLKGVSCWEVFAADEIAENRWSRHSNGVSTTLSEVEEESECSSDARPSNPGLEEEEDSQVEASPTRVSFMEPLVSDGEDFSTAHPLLCNSKGCRPLTESEGLRPMYMASVLGICMGAEDSNNSGCGGGRYGGGGGRRRRPSESFHGDSDMTDAYYHKLLQADPENPLLLRNYAQYLSEAKHDYKKSEEYYERAILACPNDGEVLSTYAKHVWDVHKDCYRAGCYFDQAVKATPDDCYVLASHASFLWESEGDKENDAIPHTLLPAVQGISSGSLPLTASA